MTDMSHIDKQGRARMVDVSDKTVTKRTAIATARLTTRTDVIDKIRQNTLAKGDVLATARVAAIMAAKKTSDLIPLCHPLPITSVTVNFELADHRVHITATVTTVAKTGVEMEALTAASVAALTVYDTCKAIDKKITRETIQLEKKTGSKSGDFNRDQS